MKETIKYYCERLYPYVVSLVFTYFFVYKKIDIIHNKNMNSKIHKICIETLAQMHFYHNIKKSTFTMISLIISGVVFFTSIAYANSVSTKTYARTGYFKDHDYIIEFINTEDYSTQNLIDMQKLHLYDEILIQRLNEIPEVKSVDKIQETQVSVNFEYFTLKIE